MNARLKEAKQAIRSFMQEHYTDERLAMLLAHARDGKFEYISCCCFIGIPTADHTLVGQALDFADEAHYQRAKLLSGSFEAELAALTLSNGGYDGTSLRRRLITIIKAEMRRRARVQADKFCSCGQVLDQAELDLMELRTYANTEEFCSCCYDRLERRQCDLESLAFLAF